jgi:hypothetical protein
MGLARFDIFLSGYVICLDPVKNKLLDLISVEVMVKIREQLAIML